MVDGVDIILRVHDGFDRGDIALRRTRPERRMERC